VLKKVFALAALVLPLTAGQCFATDAPAGEAPYNKHCISCHGPAGSGTDKGPPLVHRIYGPRKHGNAAFRLAVEWGVGAHHWFFGDMPKIKGVTEEEVDSIIIYIRALQRDAGFK